jgi:hypothetical protein
MATPKSYPTQEAKFATMDRCMKLYQDNYAGMTSEQIVRDILINTNPKSPEFTNVVQATYGAFLFELRNPLVSNARAGQALADLIDCYPAKANKILDLMKAETQRKNAATENSPIEKFMRLKHTLSEARRLGGSKTAGFLDQAARPKQQPRPDPIVCAFE